MISKRKFKDLRLVNLAANCDQCGIQHNITYPIDREGMSGTLCRDCGNIMWHTSVRHIYSPPTDPSPTVEDRVALVKKQERDYFATMPDCPTCAHHAWAMFVEDIKYPPDCRNCGKTFDSGVFRENTEKRSNDIVFWFQPDYSA